VKWLLLLGLLASAEAFADEKLWKLLQAGGQVILIRHTVTTPGAGDPPGFKLDDCSTQRNLSDEGRAHAQRISKEFQSRKVMVGRVLSSPWCRCIETAKLAFGRVDDVSQPLSNLFGRPENRDAQVKQLKEMTSYSVKENLVLVTHGSTIQALTGIAPGTGEMVVMTGGKVAGRLIVP